jgi:hypothetical protein
MFQPTKSVPREELVDFEDQLELFKQIVAEPTEKRLMFVQAPGTCGKTSLMRLMRGHCEDNGIPCCRIDFRGQAYDSPHFTLAHEVCDQLHLSLRYLAQAVQPLSSYGPEGGEARTHIEGDVTDAQVITQILRGVSPTDQNLRQRFMKDRLKRAFGATVGDFAAKKELLVCFFDQLEDISSEEEEWLLETLLRPVAERRLKGVVVITFGRRWPKIEPWEWEECAYLTDKLPPLEVKHFKEYGHRVGYPMSDEEAEHCWRTCRGNPTLMGAVVKNLKAVEVRP